MAAIVLPVFLNVDNKDDEGSNLGCYAAIDHCDRNSSRWGVGEYTLLCFLLLMLWHEQKTLLYKENSYIIKDVICSAKVEIWTKSHYAVSWTSGVKHQNFSSSMMGVTVLTYF